MTNVLIKKDGIIELPKALRTKLGFTAGKKVVLSIRDNELLVKPVENITERITDSIKLVDKKLIEEIVETEEWM
jgi:AbrB family looped-hinge helix DNA binding protein